MPIENNFQHDELSRKHPGERLTMAELTSGVQPRSPIWFETMAQYGAALSQAGVRVIVFLNGSICGSDVFGLRRLDEVGGLKRGYSRGVSGLDALLAYMREDGDGIPALPGGVRPPLVNDDSTRAFLDEHVGEAGNFTNGYVSLYEQAINKNLSEPIVCARILWSSEYHHLGRALAAIRFLDDLKMLRERQKLGREDRILVQAHGHAGLVLALASNFLCPSPITGRPKLLSIITSYAEQTSLVPTVRQIEPSLIANSLLNGASLDVLTMGTPVRYGWDPSGIGRLLHIVNHRNVRADGKTWLAKMELPQITMEMPIAWGGDYVQELAVAGSDAMPITEEAKVANKAVWEMVEPFDGFERWLECARRAVRFPTDGRCLLADYKDSTGSTNVRDHYYGHAVYTRVNTMLFNLAQIVSHFYSV